MSCTWPFWRNFVLCDGQVILHYIPLTEIASRLLCRRQYRGKQYHGFEIQLSERKPGARAFGRSNSTFWFQTAQARADYMLQAAGNEGPCIVAGLELVSDGSYGGNHQGWHAVYGKLPVMCTVHVLVMYCTCICMYLAYPEKQNNHVLILKFI